MFIAENHNFISSSAKIWLSSPTMYKESKLYMVEVFDTNWMSTVGAIINEVEKLVAEKAGCDYAVALCTGMAVLHLAMKLAGEKIYGHSEIGKGVLFNHRVFCSDMTFDATVNPVVYEDGIPVFIDTEYDTWNMSPVALEKAFEIYPKVRLIVVAHLYGAPGQIDEIKEIAKKYRALIIEDAVEFLGAKYRGQCTNGKWKETGTFGNYSCISFNDNNVYEMLEDRDFCNKVTELVA